MSVDKLVDSTQLDTDLTSVANAIRTKGGTSAQLAFPADFVSAIAAIPRGGSGLKYATGTFTPASDMTDPQTVSHTLGDVPDVIFVWTDYFESEANLPVSVATNWGCLWIKGITDISQRLTSSISASNPLFVNFSIASGASKLTVQSPTSTSYAPETNPTSTAFTAWKMGNQQKWMSAITYKFFVAKKWW